MKGIASEWAKKAEEDYKTARILLDAKEVSPSIVGFHAQQCVEKYLKAFLANNDVAPPRIHDLVRLNTICMGIAFDFENIGDSLDFLNPFSVEFRYPGIDVTVEEAKESMEHAAKVRDFIRSKLDISS